MNKNKDTACKALAVIAEKFPEEAAGIGNYISAVEQRSIAVLGHGDAFALRTRDGVIRAFQRAVELSEANGGLVNIVGTMARSYNGYKALADSIGLVTINPPTVCVDGTDQPNPFVRRDSNGRIIEVYARALCFGYTSTGVPTVSDRTAIFDVATYRLTDLLAKAKRDKTNFSLQPKGSPAPTKPAGHWSAYEVDDQTVLWVNLSAEGATGWFGEIINRARKATEFCQTFAQRNAIKHHPSIPLQRKVQGGGVEHVAVVQWRPVEGLLRFDYGQYLDLLDQAKMLTAGATVERVEGQDAIDEEAVVDVGQVIDEDSPATPQASPAEERQRRAEGLQEAFSGDDEPPSQADEETPAAAEPSLLPPPDDERELLQKNILAIGKQAPERFAEALGEIGAGSEDVHEGLLPIETLKALLKGLTAKRGRKAGTNA